MIRASLEPRIDAGEDLFVLGVREPDEYDIAQISRNLALSVEQSNGHFSHSAGELQALNLGGHTLGQSGVTCRASTVSITGENGLASSVSLTVSGLPSTVTAAFSSLPQPPPVL